jgi:hypothetical protein
MPGVRIWHLAATTWQNQGDKKRQILLSLGAGFLIFCKNKKR